MTKYTNVFETLELNDKYNKNGKLIPDLIIKIYGKNVETKYKVKIEVDDSQKLIITYLIDDIDHPTRTLYRHSFGRFFYNKIEIDGVDIDIDSIDIKEGLYLFDSIGEHIAKFTLEDPTVINEGMFAGCDSIINISLPDSIVSIGEAAFSLCSYNTIIIPKNVTFIGQVAFSSHIGNENYYLTTVILKPTTPPTLENSVFDIDGQEDLPFITPTFYVPPTSVDAYKAAWPEYADKILPYNEEQL